VRHAQSTGATAKPLRQDAVRPSASSVPFVNCWASYDAAAADMPPNQSPVIKRLQVTMADKTARVIEARGFRVGHGALVLVQSDDEERAK
jgi:hypothetical protein